MPSRKKQPSPRKPSIADPPRREPPTWMLQRCERAWRDHSVLALAEAVRICHHYDVPLPGWAARGILGILQAAYDGVLIPRGKRKTGRLATPKIAHKEWMKHYTRWDAVTELRDRQPELADIIAKHTVSAKRAAAPLDACFAAVAEYLEGTDAAGSVDSIKRSYQRVKALMNSGRVGPLFLPSLTNPLVK